ncbi:hypothetical protein [Methanosarcina barkeri]|nr:hypothetical protein [Methanosarcina barkeri]
MRSVFREILTEKTLQKEDYSGKFGRVETEVLELEKKPSGKTCPFSPD